MRDSLEEKSLYRLGVVTWAEEQGEEDQGQVETGGENVGNQQVDKEPAME